MSLPNLFVAPQDEEQWTAWAFNHAAIHYDIVFALQTQKKVTGLQQFLLNPIDPNDLGIWLYQHQAMHNQANAALGTSGFDLLELDWTDPDQFAIWLNLNGVEHQQFAQALGVE